MEFNMSYLNSDEKFNKLLEDSGIVKVKHGSNNSKDKKKKGRGAVSYKEEAIARFLFKKKREGASIFEVYMHMEFEHVKNSTSLKENEKKQKLEQIKQAFDKKNKSQTLKKVQDVNTKLQIYFMSQELDDTTPQLIILPFDKGEELYLRFENMYLKNIDPNLIGFDTNKENPRCFLDERTEITAVIRPKSLFYLGSIADKLLSDSPFRAFMADVVNKFESKKEEKEQPLYRFLQLDPHGAVVKEKNRTYEKNELHSKARIEQKITAAIQNFDFLQSLIDEDKRHLVEMRLYDYTPFKYSRIIVIPGIQAHMRCTSPETDNRSLYIYSAKSEMYHFLESAFQTMWDSKGIIRVDQEYLKAFK
jgi:hypothetical protein